MLQRVYICPASRIYRKNIFVTFVTLPRNVSTTRVRAVTRPLKNLLPHVTTHKEIQHDDIHRQNRIHK